MDTDKRSYRRGTWLLAMAMAMAAEAGAELRFREVAEDRGVDFRHHHGGSGERYMVETMVGGLVAFDFDDDGDVDLFFVDGGRLPGYEGEAPRSRLYRNDGRRFADVTTEAGIELDVYGCGATAGDVDGDGDLDLYVTAFGPDRLLRNDGGRFADVTAEAGLGEPSRSALRWTAGAAFADVDRDGDLDLYVAGYVDFTVDNHKFCGDRERGIRAYCQPGEYKPIADRLYLNRGDGHFEDATFAAGLAVPPGAGLGVVFGDLDGDGWADLYVANDETPNFLFRNRGKGVFEDLSLLSGTAYSDRGRPEAGMGVDLGDFDGDGRLDVVVTNFEFETNALYANAGDGLFTDVRWTSGFAEPTLTELAFGVAFADLDLDGDLDLAVANGHILDNAESFNSQSRYRQRNQLFENLGGGRWREAAASGLDAVRASRGLVAGDFDGDGDLDLAVNNSGDRGSVYDNVGDGGSWLAVALRTGSGNRFGVGARIEIETATGRQVREIKAGSSYLSSNPLEAHFGVGDAETVDAVTVRWPSGEIQRIRRIPVDRRLVIRRAGKKLRLPVSEKKSRHLR
ncbi:MAG: CRTAC1 family protein [Thermoanaerobaculia bacterium]